MAFNNKIDCEYYCDNCMYDCDKTRQVPVFEAYNVIAKLDIMYVGIVKYSDLLLSRKCQKLFTGNLPRGLRTAVK